MKKTNRVFPSSYVKASKSKYTAAKIDRMYEATEENPTRLNLKIRDEIEELLWKYDEDGDRTVGEIYKEMSEEDKLQLISLLEEVERNT